MYRYNEAILSEMMDETCVLYNTVTNTTHILNATAKYVWENCTMMTIDCMVDSIMDKLDEPIERKIVYEDVTEIVARFLENSIIREAE